MKLCHLYNVLFVYSNNSGKQVQLVWLENIHHCKLMCKVDKTTKENGRKLSINNICKVTFETKAFMLSVPLQF
jgi:hypothetical protein